MGKTADAIAAIPNGYAYGTPVPLAAPRTKSGRRAIRAIAGTTAALHRFHVCDKCDDSRSWHVRECRNVVVLSESDDDIMGVSNRETFAQRYGDAPGVTMHAYAYGYSFCIDPDLIDVDTLESILDDLAAHADYPLLDEDDYARRESDAWDESLAHAMNAADVPDDMRPALAEWVSENYWGYAEPGYVAPEWVAEGIAALTVA